jgi:hypothetical protein
MPELSLADELRALGRAARPDVDPDGLAARVVGALPARVEARRRVGRRVALAALAVLVALVAAPPVRATVAEWFGFGAVRVEPGGPPTRQSPAVPPVTGPMSLADAAALADFQLVAPAALGEPDGTVSSDDGSRV